MQAMFGPQMDRTRIAQLYHRLYRDGQMKIKTILVLPSLPDKISHLQELAHNLWYAWSPDLISLFKRLDRDTWEACNQNPVQMLAHVSQEKLRNAA